MNVFLLLRKYAKLAERRNPFYEQSQVAQFFVYLTAAIFIGYLIFFAVLLGLTLDNLAVEPYHLVNSGLVFIFGFDFLLRLSFQKLPTQEMKPYMLLPLKRKRLVDALLLRSALSDFNTFWLFFFVPFAMLTVIKFYGLWGVFTYCLGIWLLTVLNSYWYQLCKWLLGERMVWVLLPVAVYGGVMVWTIAGDCPVADWSVALGEGFIRGQWLTFAGVLLAIGALFALNRRLAARLVYQEMNRVADAKVRHVSEYRFFDRLGDLGEYMRLELKMLVRNKVSRQQLIMISVVVIAFALAIGFSDVYEGNMKEFMVIYNYVVFGIVFLSNLMSFEGNYIDGLMTRKESVYTLLRAKYVLYSAGMLIPTAAMLPSVFTGKVDLLTCLGWQAFVSGVVYFGLFQMAAYNKNTMPMNEKMTNRRHIGSAMQNIVSACAFGVPVALGFFLNAVAGKTGASVVELVLGVGFMATSRWWLKSVYRRFMQRRYENMEGFRNSRQK